MKGFRVLAIVAAVAVYGQIVLGGVVRITGSGLGCPDWPACQGKIVPDFANSHVVIEYAHRLVGSTAGLLMVATAAYALLLFYRPRPGAPMPRGLMIAAVAGVGLIVLQGILGGITVLMGNSPFTVAIHLGNALLVLAAALLVALWAGRALSGSPATTTSTGALPVFLYGSLAAGFLIVVSGAYVVGSGAGSACTSWPLCGAATRTASTDTHFLHRIVVLVASLVILRAVHFAHRRWRGTPMATVSYLVAAAFVLEVAIGAAQVLSGLPQVLRASHLAVATLVWSGVVLLAAGYWLETRPEVVAAPVAGRAMREATAG
ncbi:MAG TPA: COX15/CtaA family protein [Candidatus Solibacter sp.]|jgi:heme A synthase|nr:COX15/CtaA family protein [Candidatus Solibacter sp.]